LERPAKYHVTVDMSWFSSDNADVEVTDTAKPVQKDFGLSLLSQAQRASVTQAAPQTVAQPSRQPPNVGTRGNAQAEAQNQQPEADPFAELQAIPLLFCCPE
jgi:hypothetical protein